MGAGTAATAAAGWAPAAFIGIVAAKAFAPGSCAGVAPKPVGAIAFSDVGVGEFGIAKGDWAGPPSWAAKESRAGTAGAMWKAGGGGGSVGASENTAGAET